MSLVELAEHLDKFTAILSEWDDIIHIGYRPSPDNLIASAVFARVFIDTDRSFSLFECENPMIEAQHRGEGNYIFIGHDLALIQEIDQQIPFFALLSPSDAETEGLIMNIGQFGFDYPAITLTALAYLICEPISPSIDYIIHLPLVAQQAVAMKSQPEGIHEQIHTIAEEEGIIEIKPTISILGSDLYSINDALLYSYDPFLPNLTDNENRVTQLLAKAGIVAETSDGYRKFSDLEADELKELNITLINYLSKNTGFRDGKLNFIARKTDIVREKNHPILHNTWDYARAIIDTCNRKRYNLSLSVLLGNRSNKLRELTKLYKEERQSLTTSFDFLVDKQEEIIDLTYLRYLEADHKISWYNASIVAAMILAGGLVTIDLPFALIVPGPGDLRTIGIRASNQVEVGPGIKDLIETIMETKEIIDKIDGDKYAAEFSVKEDFVEQILLELNTKLGEYIG